MHFHFCIRSCSLLKVTEDDPESPIPFEEEITLGDGSTMTKVGCWHA